MVSVCFHTRKDVAKCEVFHGFGDGWLRDGKMWLCSDGRSMS